MLAYRGLGAHIHQPTARQVPHACTEPYYPGSGSYGKLFRPYLGSSARQSSRVNERGKPVSQKPFTAEASAKHSFDPTAMLMSPNKGETAVNGCHCPGDMAVCMREVLARPWVDVCVPLALNLSLWWD